MMGLFINYYLHCKRQLWFFSHNIAMEHTSEDVNIGTMISKTTYERQPHEIHISNLEDDIVLDFFDKKRKVIHEVKKTKKMEELHIWQLKYYIYCLENLGLTGVTGELDYPKQKKLIKIVLNDEDKNKIKSFQDDIEKIINMSKPPEVINLPFCKKCSYYELCYV